MKLVVSIVLPTFNREASFLHCLRSLVEQRYPKNGYEIIAIHDGSDCNYNRSQINELLAKVPSSSFECISHRGVAGVRNHGIGQARGRLILCIDDDCVADRRWVSNFVSYMSVHPNVIAAGGTVQAASPRSFVQEYVAFKGLLSRPVKDQCGNIVTLITANVCFRKKFLKMVDGFDSHIPYAGGEDVDISIRLRQRGKLGYCERAKVEHDHRSSLLALVRQHINYGRGTYLACKYNHFDYRLLKFYKPNLWGFIRYSWFVFSRIFTVSLPEFKKKKLTWQRWVSYASLDIVRKMSFNIGATLEYYQIKTS